jgi:molybdenum cofactor cytidylyltransferase
MICAVVLAAGRSERMGTQKLLLPLGGKPVIARVVDELSRSQLEGIVVVGGRDSERLREGLAGRKVQLVENLNPASDMLGSLKCGLRALPPKCQALLVALGDQPAITQDLVDALIRCLRRGDGKIVMPTRHGHRGHPVLIASQYFEELLNCSHSEGLRGFLEVHTSETFSVPVSDAEALADMDTPADYAKHQGFFSTGQADTASPL